MASATTNSSTTSVNRVLSRGEAAKSFSITKITHPRTSGIFPRKRLFQFLDELRESPVIWVSGPAGSGKTTLVASYLFERKLNSIWYRVDEGDGDIATFFYYMGLAAKKAAPRDRNPLPLLTPEYLLGIKTFVLRYFESLCNRLKPPFVIVFDNYQHAQTQSQFHEVIATGLDLIPQGIQVIIISRDEPPPQFARLRVSGKIRILQGEDILFDEDESKELIRSKGFWNLTESAVHRIYERTHGWAAGLVLMTENVMVEEIAEHALVSNAPQEIFDYFAIEIFDKMDREEREFLLRTTFLPWVTVPFAVRLTGEPRSGMILTKLHRNHFFTEKDTGVDPVYRYHPLFREFLLSRAQRLLPRQAILQIQQTAAALFMEAGQLDEAAAFFLDAGDWEGFVPFILDNAPALKLQGRIKTLGKWLSAIPADIAGNSPWLLYWTGQCALVLSPSEGNAFLERAFQLFDERGEDTGALVTWIGLVDASIFGFDDLKPLDRWIDWLEERFGSADSFPSPEIESDVASVMVMALMWRRPDHAAMERWMERALSSSRIGGYDSVRLLVLRRALNYYTWIGDKDACITMLDELLRMAGLLQAHPVHLIFDRIIKANYYAWIGDDSELALKFVEEGFALADETGIHVTDPFLAIQGASAALNKGDDEILVKYMGRLERVLHQGGGYIGFYYDFVSLRQMTLGKHAEALAYATKMLEKFREAGIPFSEAWARFLISGAAHETGAFPLAEKELDASIRILRHTGSAYFMFATILLKAFFLFTRANEKGGMEALGKAMKLGRQKGYTNATLYRKEVLSFLCAKALEGDIEVEYTREFIRRRRLVPPLPAADYEQWPWPVKIYTLGRFDIFVEGRQIEFSGKAPRRVISLLKLLVACGEGGASEEHFADILWPDSDGDAAHQSFAISLHRLRQLLGSDKALQLRDGVLKIDPRICWVDAHAFDELLVLAEKEVPEDEERLLGKALGLYQGSFLKGLSEPWAISYRERLCNRFLRTVRRLGEHL